MSLINQESGDLAFSDGFCLRAGMPARELSERLFAMREGIACLPAHPAHGGSLAPVCQLENGGLQLVTLYVDTINGKPCPGADRRRAFLFSALHLKDPYPDTRRSVKVRCPFGELMITTDPYTGQTSARIQYVAREKPLVP